MGMFWQSYRYAFGHFFVVKFILLALLVQSFIPNGYMPSLTSGKIFQIVICQGNEQSVVTVDADMNRVAPHKQGHDKSDMSAPCVFAALSAQQLIPQLFLYDIVRYVTHAQQIEHNLVEMVTVLPTKYYSSQGPPSNLI